MTLSDYRNIVHRCFRCGYCKLTDDYSQYNCPSYSRFRLETYAPGGMLWLIRAWMENEIEWTSSLANILQSCTACSNCVANCKFEFNQHVLNIILAAREEMVENGLVAPGLARFFKNIEATGNPFRELPGDRGKWADNTGIPQYNGHDYLLYVGCVASYDSRGQEIVRALGHVLLKAGVSFGILGLREKCDGNEVNMLGEKRIFNMLAYENTQNFDILGVRKIIALSPHSYNAFKKLYPNKYEVYHYTQILCLLLRERKLNLSEKLNIKLTFHDPCFLGRHNDEYEAPREVLNSIPGIELVEMNRNRQNAFCCGGGSGNFYIDSFGGGENSPARSRVREALETGADVLAVACPTCMIMLNDAIKSENLEGELAVKDICEVVKQAL